MNRNVLESIDVFGEKLIADEAPDKSRTMLDLKGNFWYVAQTRGLYKVNLTTRRVSRYRYTTRLLYPYLAGIERCSGDTLWIGAGWHGLMKFDPASGLFISLPNPSYTGRILKDREGKIWIASDGLEIYDPVTGMRDRHVYDPSDPHSLSDNEVGLMYDDPSGRIWVGAANAVNLWDPLTRSFKRFVNPAFDESQGGEPIGSDRKGRLWLRSGAGRLAILDPLSGKFTSFDITEGVCGHLTDMENLDDGRVLLSGWGGLNIVSPDSIDPHRSPPALVITRLAINDKPVVPPVLLNDSGSLTLSHAQNVLELEFAATDIEAPQLVQYRYRLEGLEKEWVAQTDRRYVRYPGLSPGNYIFRVRAASAWNEWPDQEIALAISIAPPWWRTAWAYACYLLLLVGLLYSGYRIRMRQVHLKHEMEIEHVKAEQLAEVDGLKSRFFANISHEFRTPLTLILGPLETIRSKLADEESQHAITMMQRNAQRLLRLINQLLDLSKIDAGGMKLQASRGNIVPFVKGIAQSFQSSAGRRGVALHVEVEKDEIELYFDQDKMEKIVTNLISNAYTFTPEGGSVTVRVTSSSQAPAGSVEIIVADTGIGIPEQEIPRIFDRFYQVDPSQKREQEGTGIGLALTRELVELHQGTIKVKSEVGKGAEFTVSFRLGKEHLRPEEIVEVPPAPHASIHGADTAVPAERENAALQPGGRESQEQSQEQPLVLIVEDNADVRTYIRGYLVPAYRVLEAADGIQGVNVAGESIPDLIISDVMMPKMDGYALCRSLKLDEKTSHIPIILLTAKAGQENKIEGLETGADDYLTKPFEAKELLVRVKNLIDLRRKLREHFSVGQVLKPGEIAVTSIDDAFLKKVMQVVEERLGNEAFSVEDLAGEAGMSRSQLHRKLTSLTGQSPSDFIRYMRLHRAMELLRKNAGTVSEIAYTVGFSGVSYFTKSFKEQFGTLPSEVNKT